MLYGGSSDGSAGGSDSYKTAVIDTIVAEVQSTPGEDRCVLLLGYKNQIETMFRVRSSISRLSIGSNSAPHIRTLTPGSQGGLP